MLAAQAQAGSFLEAPAPSPTISVEVPSLAEGPGTVVGPYKLLQLIGEGGMGAVYMAEQTAPVKRVVALKVIKAGMDSRQVLARFDAERQALAMMDHPNIARVLDAGATDQGRPYFVMELVKGVPITRYCDEKHLTPRERLELFIPVCQAVQHAHQKGIIHRDLKPSNVVVGLYDGQPIPKVIDFGVAKAMGQKLTEQTLFTGFGTVIGTPEYMSPEQAQLENVDIDTRSDIYSLGVLLYELLTGTTPLQHKRVQQAAVLEVLRLIREEEPPKPSTRLGTTEELPSIAANRNLEPKKLTGLVRGDLDWIVMKCLEKDRNRRYETANALTRDIEHYLHDEPVAAGPPSAWYRCRKFARRNKGSLAVAALVLFFLLLLGSGVGWVWRDRAARQAEQTRNLEQAVERAEFLQRQGKRGEALAALERAQLLSREAAPAPPLAGRIDSLRQLLDAEGRDEIFVARFEAIRREVQSEVDVEKSEFRRRKSYPTIREALEQCGIAVGATPPAAVVAHIQKRPPAIQTVVITALDECVFVVPGEDPRTREWLVDVLQRADDDPWRNKVRRAWKQPEVLEALARDIDVHQQPPGFLLLVANALPIESPSRLELVRRVQFAYPGDFWVNHKLGFDLAHAGKVAEAIRYYTAALALRPDNPGVLLNRAKALRQAGELETAIADLRRAITLAPRYAGAYNNLGVALDDQKKLDEAILAYRKAIELDPKSSKAHNNLGIALHDQKKLDEAILAYRKAIELDPKDAAAHSNLGNALRDQKKLDEAIAAHRKAIELDPKKADSYYNLGIALRDQKKLDEAVLAYRKAIELDPKDADAHSNLGKVLNDLAWTLATDPAPARRDPGRAVSAAREAVEMNPQERNHHNTLGVALYRAGHWKEAVATLEKSMALSKGGDSFDWFFLAMAHWQLGDHEKARTWYGQAARWMDQNQPQDEELRRFRAEAAELLEVKEKK
jgi:serine/threonine protein kinase/Flp pilus assembly protein TadD